MFFASPLLLQLEALDEDVLHDLVALQVGVQAVAGAVGVHGLVVGDEGGVVVEDGDVVLATVLGNHGVELLNLLGQVGNLGTPAGALGGREQAEDGTDAVGTGELAHGDDVVEGVLEGYGTVVEADVVDTSKDGDKAGLHVDDILTEAAQHLAADLSADAAAQQVVRLEERGVLVPPALGDGVTV